MSANSVVGRRVRKVDGVKLVTGSAAFTDDIELPGMLIGKILPQPARPRAHPAHRHAAGRRRCPASTRC